MQESPDLEIIWASYKHDQIVKYGKKKKTGLILLEIDDMGQDHFKYYVLFWPPLSTTPMVDYVLRSSTIIVATEEPHFTDTPQQQIPAIL